VLLLPIRSIQKIPSSTAAVGKVPSYGLADLNATWRVRNITARLGISNLFNRQYFTKRRHRYPVRASGLPTEEALLSRPGLHREKLNLPDFNRKVWCLRACSGLLTAHFSPFFTFFQLRSSGYAPSKTQKLTKNQPVFANGTESSALTFIIKYQELINFGIVLVYIIVQTDSNSFNEQFILFIRARPPQPRAGIGRCPSSVARTAALHARRREQSQPANKPPPGKQRNLPSKQEKRPC
jgi:hypothetical protein